MTKSITIRFHDDVDDYTEENIPERNLFIGIINRALDDVKLACESIDNHVKNYHVKKYSITPISELLTSIDYIFFPDLTDYNRSIINHLNILYEESQVETFLLAIRKKALKDIRKNEKLYNYYLRENYKYKRKLN